MRSVKQEMAVAAWILCGVSVFMAATPAYGETPTDRLAWWREARFGLFIHWGPVSLKGTEIGWSRGGERRGTGGKGPIPVDVYDNLYKEFNPVEFDADEWVQIATNAGMKYLVFTTKHHDGFCNFDSALTEYKITNSPFKRDIVKELADACHKGGLGLGFYYSPPDWHHPDYRTDNHQRYIEYLHGQLRELCTNYGKVDILWFDGLGGTAKDWGSEDLIKMIRSLQPGIIINNRPGLPEDFDTPEQRVGAFQIDRAWETCMTIGTQWAWKPNDRIKSLKQCLHVLITCAGGDGNLLFNVGPMPDGRIEPRQVERLDEMGAWLEKYGESIYNTRGGPFMPGSWGVSTHRDKTVYVHILDWVEPTLELPPIPAKILGHTVLTGGTASLEQTGEAVRITVPETAQQDIDTIIALELDRPAGEIPPIHIPSGNLAYGKKAVASNVHQKDARYAPGKAFDDNDATRWATDGGTHEAWLEVDLGEPTEVARVVIKESCGERVQDFALQCRHGDAWKDILTGTKIGEKFQAKFEPVTAQVFRLDIRKATEGPTIWEFQLFSPKK